jgi:hypothetical protein
MKFLQHFVQDFRRYRTELGLIFTVFLIAVTMTNFAYNIFGFRLTEFFEVTFSTLHDFLHVAMYLLVYSWFTPLLQVVWFGLTWLGSLMLHFIEPEWRVIRFPQWWSDLALGSIVLSRAFDSAYLMIPWDERGPIYDDHEKDPTKEIEIQVAHGPLSGLHRITHLLTTGIWQSIRFVEKIITKPVMGMSLPQPIAEAILKNIASAVAMWGYIRLVGYGINVGMAGRLRHIPMMRMRVRIFKLFWISFALGAAVCSGFLYVNGLLAGLKLPL